MNHYTREIKLIWLSSTNQGLLPGAEDEVGISWHHDFAVKAEDLNTIWILLQGRIRQALLVSNQYCQVTMGSSVIYCDRNPVICLLKTSQSLPSVYVPSCVLCPCGFMTFCSFITILVGSLKGKVKNMCSVSLPVWKPPANVSQTGSCRASVCIAYSEWAMPSVLTNERKWKIPDGMYCTEWD